MLGTVPRYNEFVRIGKNMTNLEIADLLRAVAAAYQIKGKSKNKFRITAYERAADAVEHLSSEAKDLWDDGKLESVAGIGENIAEYLGEIFKTGKSKHFKKVFKGISPAVFDLIPISGIGPVTACRLVEELKITSKKPINQLLTAAKAGKIETIEGFGKDSQESIIKSIKEYQGREKRLLLNYATNIAEGLMSWLKKCNEVKQVDVLGSLRRKASTIGDIDIAVATNKPEVVTSHFTKYKKAKRVLEKGDRTASIILPGEIQIDLMIQESDSYGSLLQHFTGSKHHNIALREFALKKHMSLSEYGIKKRVTDHGSRITKFKTEKQFYNFLGMDWIPPELREDTGEIEAALRQAQGKQDGLPNLVTLKQIKADLQIHSDFDIETSHDLGESSMQDLVDKANELGYEYIAFTEHNPSHGGHSDKQIIDLLKRKRAKVEQINTSFVKNKNDCVIKVFNSLEIDILPDGKLPVSNKGLELLDFALVSIHSSFRQSRAKMTKRVLAALSHPKVKIFAHPTARKLNQREGVELDWPKIFDFCKRNDKWLEINADPMRLDLPDLLAKDAIEEGVLLTLGTDAHNSDMLENMEYGVSVARRGWAEKENVVNTLSLNDFESMLES